MGIAIASAIVIWEYRRSALKDEAKAEALEKEKEEVRNTITNLEFTVERQSVQKVEEVQGLHLPPRGSVFPLVRCQSSDACHWLGQSHIGSKIEREKGHRNWSTAFVRGHPDCHCQRHRDLGVSPECLEG